MIELKNRADKIRIKVFKIAFLFYIKRIFFYADILKCTLLLITAYLIKPFFNKHYQSRQIWIVGENTGEILKDNGYFFFKYCCQDNLNEDVYLLAKKKYIKNDSFLDNNPDIVRVYSKRANARVKTFYRWEKIMSAYVELFEALKIDKGISRSRHIDAH